MSDRGAFEVPLHSSSLVPTQERERERSRAGREQERHEVRASTFSKAKAMASLPKSNLLVTKMYLQ